MDTEKNPQAVQAWEKFETSGRIADYLNYVQAVSPVEDEADAGKNQRNDTQTTQHWGK